jgi:chromosomal replication initiator protein
MIFDTVQNLLRQEIPKIEFEKYIRQLTFDERRSKSDNVILIVQNPYIAKWIETKYSAKIAHLFELQTGIKPTITILVSNKEGKTVGAEETYKSINQSHKNPKSTILNPSFTFDSFVVGSSNQFAFNATMSVAEKPGKLYNPLFLYGGVGLGKTHLLNAIGNRLAQNDKNIIYATIEQFMNDFTTHIRNQTMDRFREKYRNCDLLLIDDVQFLSKKEGTQEEFFHTFNELYQQGKQIVMTSDKHPKKIGGLEERLKSRFESGLIADISKPELETKIAIIIKKCEINGISLEQDVVHYIAATLDDNIREIEGAIIKLNAFAKMMNQQITLDFSKSVLKDQIKETKENITLEQIITVVSTELNIKPSEIRSKSRSSAIVNARRVVIYLAINLTTQNSMKPLAEYLGMKDHSAVSHALKKINEMVENDTNFATKIEELKNKIKSK